MKPKSDTSEGRKQRSETAMDERLLKQLTEQLAKANLAAELELDAGLEATAQANSQIKSLRTSNVRSKKIN